MCNLINTWLNLEFYSTIGEPWDFISDKGENILEGKIIDILEKNNEIYLLCETCSFCYKGKMISKVIIYNRYSRSQEFSIENAIKSSGIIVHFLFNSSGEDINFSDIMENISMENISMEKFSFLIGSFHINLKCTQKK